MLPLTCLSWRIGLTPEETAWSAVKTITASMSMLSNLMLKLNSRISIASWDSMNETERRQFVAKALNKSVADISDLDFSLAGLVVKNFLKGQNFSAQDLGKHLSAMTRQWEDLRQAKYIPPSYSNQSKGDPGMLSGR
jgi:hypothetical protein